MITEDSTLGVVLLAKTIPDGGTVTKLTGTARYTIRHSLKVYQNQTADKNPPIVIAGTFLLNDRGVISQISEETKLVWLTTAGDLHDWLTMQFEESEIPQ